MSLSADDQRVLMDRLSAVLRVLAKSKDELPRRVDEAHPLAALQAAVSDWAEYRWPGVDVMGKGRKLSEEAGEFTEAAGRWLITLEGPQYRDRDVALLRAIEELADAQCVVLHAWRLLGVEGPAEIAAVCRAVWEMKTEVSRG